MAKFTVNITRAVTREEKMVVEVSKAEVVEALGLDGADRREWRDHVQEYLENDVERLDDADVLHVSEEDTTDVAIDSVEETD